MDMKLITDLPQDEYNIKNLDAKDEDDLRKDKCPENGTPEGVSWTRGIVEKG